MSSKHELRNVAYREGYNQAKYNVLSQTIELKRLLKEELKTHVKMTIKIVEGIHKAVDTWKIKMEDM